MDKIIDILKLLDGMESEEDYADAEREIRQQIGRELLDPNIRTYGYTAEMIARIREVCKLEEE